MTLRCTLAFIRIYVGKGFCGCAAVAGVAGESAVVAIFDIGLAYHYGRELRSRRWLFERSFRSRRTFRRPRSHPLPRGRLMMALAVLVEVPRGGVASFTAFNRHTDEARRILDAVSGWVLRGPITYNKSDELARGRYSLRRPSVRCG